MGTRAAGARRGTFDDGDRGHPRRFRRRGVMNLALWLWRAAQRWPDRPALFSGAEQLADYRAFAARASALAAWLGRAHGIAPGDRIALFRPNSPDYLVTLYAIWFAGGVAVPINAKLHPAEAAWIVGHAEASLEMIGDAQGVGDDRQRRVHGTD